MKKVPKKALKVDFGLHNMSSKRALWYAHAYLRPWWDHVINSFTLGKFPKLYLGLTRVLYLELKFRATQRERQSDFHILVCTMHYLLSAFLMCCLPKIAVRVTEQSRYTHCRTGAQVSPLGYSPTGCNLQVKPLHYPLELLPWPQSRLTDWVIKNREMSRQAGQ